jgi:DNA-binding NarL/FixJ family response regulator
MNVLLADDQVSERKALRRVLEQEPELCLVGEATEAESLLAQARAKHPDLVLLNWELPGLPVENRLAPLQTLDHPQKVVVFGEKMRTRQEALAAGANAYISKEEPLEWLLSSLLRVVGLSPCYVR